MPRRRTLSFTADEVRYRFTFAQSAKSFTNNRMDDFERHVRHALVDLLIANDVPVARERQFLEEFESGATDYLGHVVLGRDIVFTSRPYHFKLPFNEHGTIYTLEWTE